MKEALNDRYRRAAEEFARRVTSAMGDQIDSIVLYGSVARGEARKGSDIDILVISSDLSATRGRVSDMRTEFERELNYTLLIQLTQRSTEDLQRLIDVGSPFIAQVLQDGVILHDNGSFVRARQAAVGVG